MRIIDKRMEGATYFENLESGDCFIDNDDITHMKICADGSEYNAVRLCTGWCCHFDNNETVLPVKAELTIS